MVGLLGDLFQDAKLKVRGLILLISQGINIIKKAGEKLDKLHATSTTSILPLHVHVGEDSVKGSREKKFGVLAGFCPAEPTPRCTGRIRVVKESELWLSRGMPTSATRASSSNATDRCS